MTFAWPWAGWLLAAVGLHGAIYLLRRRLAEHRVPSLLLWRLQTRPHPGGRRLERFRTGLLYLIELLILLLLCAAAAGPRTATAQGGVPLVVVLDDSFSMSAAGGEPRRRALEVLEKELATGRHGSVSLLPAGRRARFLARDLEKPEVGPALAGWRAGAGASALDEAIALAVESAGRRGRILVLTDRAPPSEIEAGRLEWWAFGRRRVNAAFTGASRRDVRGGSSVALEVTNFSTHALSLRLETNVRDLVIEPFELAPGESRRLRRQIGTTRFEASRFEASLAIEGGPSDAVAVDDRVVLLPEPPRTVEIASELGTGGMAALVRRALEVSGRVEWVAEGGEILLTERGGESVSADRWVVELDRGGDEVAAYTGPFVLDRSHPLSEGLDLGGVIWGLGRSPIGEARPVIAAGEVPLVIDRAESGGRRLRLRLRPEVSTLQNSPNWPILWWNVLEWRGRSASGPRRVNLLLGQSVEWVLAAEAEELRVEGPAGRESVLRSGSGSVGFEPEAAGIYRLRSEVQERRIAVNAIAPGESDLRLAASGRWGRWSGDGPAGRGERSWAWAFLLAALGVLALHQALDRRHAGVRG